MAETHDKRTETHACNLISRQAALDVLAEWHDEAITNRLNNLPSAQPKWIPCNERLPGDDEEVIVSCTDDSGDYSLDYTTVGWHYKGLWVVNNERSFLVRAWMPLPEPWKGEQHGTSRAVLSQKPMR